MAERIRTSNLRLRSTRAPALSLTIRVGQLSAAAARRSGGSHMLESPGHSRENDLGITQAVPAVAARADVHPAFTGFRGRGCSSIPANAHHRGAHHAAEVPQTLRVVAQSALIFREAAGARRLAERRRKPRNMSASCDVSHHEKKDFGFPPKVLSKNIPERVRTSNLRLRSSVIPRREPSPYRVTS